MRRRTAGKSRKPIKAAKTPKPVGRKKSRPPRPTVEATRPRSGNRDQKIAAESVIGDRGNRVESESDPALAFILAAKELSAALQRAFDGPVDLSPIAPAVKQYRETLEALYKSASVPQPVKAVLPYANRMPYRGFYRVITAFHEAAHAVVASLTRIAFTEVKIPVPGGVGISSQPPGVAGATVTKPFDPHTDGDAQSWTRRFACMCFAGYSGGLFVEPGVFSEGAVEDFQRAERILIESGLDPDAERDRLSRAAVDLVTRAREAVFGVALALLNGSSLTSDEVRNILSAKLPKGLLDELEEAGRAL